MQYLKDYQTFVNTARYWTESFAKTSSRGVEDKVINLLHLSFWMWLHIIKHILIGYLFLIFHSAQFLLFYAGLFCTNVLF